MAASDAFWPLVLYSCLVLLVVGAMWGLSYVLGERREGRATQQPYESGMEPTGSARLRYDVKFYQVAMFFVVFDLEAAFLFAWAIAVPELGWTAYITVVVFVAILLAALFYLWRIGALEWGPDAPRRRSLDRSKEHAQRR